MGSSGVSTREGADAVRGEATGRVVGLAEVDVEVLGERLAAGGQGQPEVHLGPGREALGVGHRQLRPPQRPLQQAGDVAVAGEAHLAELGVPEADPHVRSPATTGLSGRRRSSALARFEGLAGQQRHRDLAADGEVLAGALAAAGGRDGRGHDVLDGVAGAGAAVVAGGPAAVLEAQLVERVAPVLPEEVLVEPGGDVVPGQDLVLVAVAVDVPLDVEPVAGHGLVPGVLAEVLAPLLERAAGAPDVLDDRAEAAIAAAT